MYPHTFHLKLSISLLCPFSIIIIIIIIIIIVIIINNLSNKNNINTNTYK